MKSKAVSFAATACFALGTTAALAGCGGSSGSSSTASHRSTGTSTGTTVAAAATTGDASGNIAAGVAPDPAAVKLLPSSVKKRGSITAAMDLAYPPTSFLSQSNQPEGFNVDIARLIAAKLGLKLKIANVSFETIIPGLNEGRYDMTTTDMSATPARLKVLDMIDYWSDGSSLETKAGNPEHLNINTSSICGKSIAVMTGTTQQQIYLPALSKAHCTSAGKPAVKTVTLPNLNGALTQLASGRLDGIFYDTPSLAYAGRQHGTTFTLTTPQYAKPAKLGTDLVAIGLAKNSPLTKPVQVAMQSIMNGPLYMKALDRWGLGSGAIKTASVATSLAN